MNWRQYQWPAIGAGVVVHVATVAVLSWAIDPRVGLPAGPLVGGAITGVLAHPNLIEMKNGFVSGAIGAGGTVLAWFVYWIGTDPSWIGAYLVLPCVAASLLVGGGLGATAAGTSAAARGLATWIESEPGS